MSKRRKPGDWVRLVAGAGMCCESGRLRAEIRPEEEPDACLLCKDPDCKEWATLWTEPDPEANGRRHTLYHVSECQMLDDEPEFPAEYRALRCLEELDRIIEEAGEGAAILCLHTLRDLQAEMTEAGILTERKPTDDPPY